MGFSTIYLAPFNLSRKLNDDEYATLKAFSESEHPDIVKHSKYCQWIPSEDRCHIELDKNEKFYNGKDWIVFLIDHFFKQWDIILYGESPWYIDDFEEAGILKIENNIVSEHHGEIHAIKAKYGELDIYSTLFEKIGNQELLEQYRKMIGEHNNN